ncbi:hypothetical protein M0R72_01180 [Candidatus Pacearchaeota archaeon]|jgi:hypothetical protein|nr:hypothetical protein [Candidatus Pacearchaeota archaeon]
MAKTSLQAHEGWIPKDSCKDRFLYRINSRNLFLGVFRAATGGFIGLRTKFGSVYAFEEYHWDNEAFATVKPEEQLEELPAEIVLDTGLGSRCHNCHKTCAYIDFLDGPREKDYGGERKVSIRGEWKHTEPSDCTEVLAYGEPNAPLEKWLHEMEAKYVSD